MIGLKVGGIRLDLLMGVHTVEGQFAAMFGKQSPPSVSHECGCVQGRKQLDGKGTNYSYTDQT